MSSTDTFVHMLCNLNCYIIFFIHKYVSHKFLCQTLTQSRSVVSKVKVV